MKFFLTENSESDDFRSPEKEALRRCWRRLVNGLDVEKLLEKLEERRIPAKSRVSLKQYVIVPKQSGLIDKKK